MREDIARKALQRRGLRLEYLTIGWNALEGVGAITAGIVARSVALTAFGLDSSIEVLASSVAAWQLRAEGERRDRPALRLIGVCFLVVAAYVGTESVIRLLDAERPKSSPVGIVLTAAAVVVMTVLGLAKRKVGRELSNKVLTAEAHFSLVDAALSGTVLVGLLLNAALGWWWADPIAAIAIALLALSEGVEGIRA